jgi:tRNA threonylcarbamoyladenosine biosynthesis protein TsaB
MIILAFDCASAQCGVALRLADGRIETTVEACQHGQVEIVLPSIITLLARASVHFTEIGRLAVTTGPGSFTGVRVGLALARGLHLALDIPVVGIDSFTAFDAGIAASAGSEIPRAIVIESRRRELYWRMMGGDQTPRSDTPEQIAAQLPPGPVLIGGDGADHLTGLRPDLHLVTQKPGPDPRFLAELALMETGLDPFPSPRYIRPPDAEVKTQTVC